MYKMTAYGMVTCFMLLILLGDRVLSADAQTLNQSIELMNEKLKGYDRRHRPIENQSLALQVNVSFDIIAIQAFDEVNSLFSVVGLVYITWYDSRIVWDSSLYGGIQSQLYEPSNVWYPVLILGNPFDSLSDIASNSTNVRFYSNGFASFVPGSVFKTTCSVDVTYYPFDTQTCHLRFIPWGYHSDELILYSPRTDVLQTYYTGNGEWSIVSTEAYHDDINTVWFSFTLRRKPLFLVINVLLPVMFLAFVNVLVFLLPCESGERMSYCITVLLSIAVFLTLVGDNLPKTSEPMSILSYYLMLILVLSLLICLAVILNLKLFYRKDQNSVSWWGKTIVSVFDCKCGKKSKVANESDNIRAYNGDKSVAMAKMTEEISKSLFENYQPSRAQTSHDKGNTIITWVDVSLIVDKLFMILFTGAIVFLSVVFISVLTTHDQ